MINLLIYTIITIKNVQLIFQSVMYKFIISKLLHESNLFTIQNYRYVYRNRKICMINSFLKNIHTLY